ncbi:MAG: biopolymer transporter ExbD [Synergistaceae bacterium]|jgi:biopolymer transport protein ExbD|nr:biopolymer transporter ExbD [Synergistaceae bacterium]
MRGRARRRGADIDITPLIDVLFMLIIFFVLAASFPQGRVPVDLPQGRGEPGREPSVTVTLTRDGSIFWDGRPAVSGDFPRLAEEVPASADILVAGDRDVSYGAVAELLQALQNAGITRVGLTRAGGPGPDTASGGSVAGEAPAPPDGREGEAP